MSIRSNRPFAITEATLVATRSQHDNKALILNRAAGTAVTLAKATGSGFRAKFIVGTASNANTFATSGTDTFVGGYLQGDSGDTTPAEADLLEAVAGNNRLSPTTAGGGGAVGDWVEFEDYASGVWKVWGVFKAVTDPTNRFSTV